MDNNFLSFAHSLLRYAVLLTLIWAFLVNLRGWLMDRPILTGERMFTILAMVLCHVQLVVGIILYAMNFSAISKMQGVYLRFYKYEHITTMIVAIALITLGRSLSKRAQDEGKKQKIVAICYGIGLFLILWAIPWPFRDAFSSLGWL